MRVCGAALTLFGLLGAHTMLQTARDALFLARLPASHLPFAYLGVAVGAFLFGNVSTILVWRLGRRNALIAVVVLGACVTASFWAALAPGRTWLLYALYVWAGIFVAAAVVAFWLLASEMFTVAQGKRLFGIVGAGAALGALAGAAAAGAWASRFPPEPLLLASAAVQLATGLAPLALPATRAKGCLFCPFHNRVSFWTAVGTVRRHPYLLRVAALIAVSTITLMVVDYQFKAAAVAAVPRDRLGAFFGTANALFAGLVLVVQAFSGPVVRRFGVVAALGVLPALLLVGSLALPALGGLAAALAIKATGEGLEHSFHRAGSELLYMPLSVELRERVKMLLDGAIGRGSQALAAIGLLVLGAIGTVGPLPLGLLLAAGSAVWLLLVHRLRRPYVQLFRETLARGHIDTRLGFPELDVTSLEALVGALNSPDDGVVIAALDVLASKGKQKLVPALLLYHHSPPVLVSALNLLSHSVRRDHVPLVERLLRHDDDRVRTAAVRAWLAGGGSVTALDKRREDSSPVVRALIAVATRDARWIEELASGPADVRAALLDATEDAELVRRLADHGRVDMVAAAARAMKRLRDPRFLRELIAMLHTGPTRPAVREAILAFGDSALTALDEALGDPKTPVGVRRHLPRTVSRFRTVRAAEILLRHLERQEDGVVRYKILRGLGRMVTDDPLLRLDRAPVRRVALATARKLHRYWVWRARLARETARSGMHETECGRLLLRLLDDKQRLGLERLFRLVALEHPRERVIDLHAAMVAGDTQQRANALEVLESLIRSELREWMRPLVEDLDDDARLAWVSARLPEIPVSREEVLREMLAVGDDTLRTLAAYHAAELGLRALRPEVEEVGASSPRAQGLLSDAIATFRGPEGAHAG